MFQILDLIPDWLRIIIRIIIMIAIIIMMIMIMIMIIRIRLAIRSRENLSADGYALWLEESLI